MPLSISGGFLFFCFFYHSFILCRSESRPRPILTPYDVWRQWDSNIHTPTCESPTLPLLYGRFE